MTSLRIAIIKPDWSIRGGFELVLDRIIEHLVREGHRIDLLSFNAWESDGRPFGVPIAESEVAEAPQFFSYVAQFEQCRQIDVRRADVVISTQPPSFAVNHTRHLSIFYHHNRIFYDLAHEAVAAGLVPQAAHEAAKVAVRKMDDDALSRVGVVLAGSESVQQRLDLYNNRRDGVRLFHAGPSTAPILTVRPPVSDRIALCISRHDFPKRTELFAHAIRLCPDVKGVSVGAGGRLGFVRQLDHQFAANGTPPALAPELTWLNNPPWIDPADDTSAGGNLQFRSLVSDVDIRALFASAFCFVAPALLEDYGLTAIEAMQSGVPLITCTDSGHLNTFVEHGVTGLVVEPTGMAIAEAIRTLAADPALAEEMGNRAREQTASFTWERALAEFDAAFSEVLA